MLLLYVFPWESRDEQNTDWDPLAEAASGAALEAYFSPSLLVFRRRGDFPSPFSQGWLCGCPFPAPLYLKAVSAQEVPWGGWDSEIPNQIQHSPTIPSGLAWNSQEDLQTHMEVQVYPPSLPQPFPGQLLPSVLTFTNVGVKPWSGLSWGLPSLLSPIPKSWWINWKLLHISKFQLGHTELTQIMESESSLGWKES